MGPCEGKSWPKEGNTDAELKELSSACGREEGIRTAALWRVDASRVGLTDPAEQASRSAALGGRPGCAAGADMEQGFQSNRASAVAVEPTPLTPRIPLCVQFSQQKTVLPASECPTTA